MKKAFNFKIVAFLGMLLSLFICITPTAHAEVDYTGLAPGEDPASYNRDWRQANVKYWIKYENYPSFWFGLQNLNKTGCYIRITDEKGNLIENILKLKASYIIDGQPHLAAEYNTNNTGKFFSSGKQNSKDGEFTICTDERNKENMGKKFLDSKGKESFYEECNYHWSWNYKVEKIVYLYVWYLDPTTGEEVAGSFLPDGVHPMYDENGILQGIYDVNGNIMNDLNMGADGIIEDETGKDILSWTDQFEGSVEQKLDFWDLFDWGFGNTSNWKDRLPPIIYIVISFVISIGLLFLIFKLGKKFFKWVLK